MSPFLFGLDKNGRKAELKVEPDLDFSISCEYAEDIITQLNSLGINTITLFPEEENVFEALNDKYKIKTNKN